MDVFIMNRFKAGCHVPTIVRLNYEVIRKAEVDTKGYIWGVCPYVAEFLSEHTTVPLDLHPLIFAFIAPMDTSYNATTGIIGDPVQQFYKRKYYHGIH